MFRMSLMNFHDAVETPAINVDCGARWTVVPHPRYLPHAHVMSHRPMFSIGRMSPSGLNFKGALQN